MTKDEARQLCKTDRMYLGKVLGYDFQEDVHPDLFADLSNTDKFYRLILWPRGHYKTSAVVVQVVATILNDPDTRILVMQATLKLTKGWVKEIASHFDGSNSKSRLLQLFPEFAVTTRNADGFTVAARTRKHLKEYTVTAASPKAVNTGQHYTRAFFDDLVNPLNYKSADLQDELEKQFNHYQPLIDPGGFVTVTGTRYSFADLYQRIINRNRGEWIISVRKCYKADGSLLFPARPIPGRPDPIGFTKERLEQERSNDPETFSAQWLNEILIGSVQKFPEQLILGAVRDSKHPEYPAGRSTYFFVDLAEGQRAESDDSVIAIARPDVLGRTWVLDCIGDKWSTHKLATVILQQAVIHRPACIWIEKQPGATFFKDYLEVTAREHNISIRVELEPGGRQKNAKLLRIGTLETFLRSKRLFLCAGIKDFDKLLEEFTQFPKGRHDDRPDCIALLVGKLAQSHFPQATRPFVNGNDFVINGLLADTNPTQKTASLCGYGFV